MQRHEYQEAEITVHHFRRPPFSGSECSSCLSSFTKLVSGKLEIPNHVCQTTKPTVFPSITSPNEYIGIM